MTGKVSLTCAFVFLFGYLTLAAVKPDFNGAWVMDRERSFGLPGNMQQTMTVKQTGDQIEVETKLIQPGNERSVKDTYVVDGKEYEFSPNATPDDPKPTGKRTASWLPNESGILVKEMTTSKTKDGALATTQVVKKWTFTAEGEITIAMFVDAPTVSYEAKRIFVRQKS